MSHYSHYSDAINKYGGIDQYIEHKRKGSQGFLVQKIVKNFPNQKLKILEIGSGVGTLSYMLAAEWYDVTSLEVDKQMIKTQKELCGNAKNKWDIIQADMFDIDKLFSQKQFDIVVSLGVIEHFPVDKIKLSLTQQSKISKMVVVAVPSIYLSNKYKRNSIGDELFTNIKEWLAIINSKDITCTYHSGLLFGRSSKYHLPNCFGRIKFLSERFANFAAFYVFIISDQAK